jgi:predicted glycoside hydrolase/deacetylase ChbG (UPF0249 family)
VSPSRVLVVNADDFGRSPGVNRGVIEAHEQGIVTSASLMVRYPAASEAASYARRNPRLSLGLHVDLGEWVYRDREWQAVYELEQTGEEVGRQLTEFRRLVGNNPTHLDSHQHVHRDEPARSTLRELAEELAIPLRHVTRGIAYCGAFYGQTTEGNALPELVTVDALTTIIENLTEGVSEICCHPAHAIDFPTSYGDERLRELDALCDPRVREVIERAGVELRSFREVQTAWHA